jgi:hypothetical protein
VQNRVIEIHDSALDEIALVDGVAVIHFPEVYIHSSEGRPAIDAGTGWAQEAILRIGNAQIQGQFPKESREAYGGYGHYLSGGALRIDGNISKNLIPVPLDVRGKVELTMECWGEIVRIQRNSAQLELLGTAIYVDEFKP